MFSDNNSILIGHNGNTIRSLETLVRQKIQLEIEREALKKETEKDILFRFSSEFGLVNSDDLSGEPVYISIFDRKTLPAEQIDPKQKKLNAEAVRYVVPSTVDVNIFDSNKNKFATLTTPMAQFGRVEFLSSELFNKHITTQVTFNTITGSLKKITDAALGE